MFEEILQCQSVRALNAVRIRIFKEEKYAKKDILCAKLALIRVGQSELNVLSANLISLRLIRVSDLSEFQSNPMPERKSQFV